MAKKKYSTGEIGMILDKKVSGDRKQKAKDYECTEAFLSLVTLGLRSPSPKMLEDLGFYRVKETYFIRKAS